MNAGIKGAIRDGGEMGRKPRMMQEGGSAHVSTREMVHV